MNDEMIGSRLSRAPRAPRVGRIKGKNMISRGGNDMFPNRVRLSCTLLWTWNGNHRTTPLLPPPTRIKGLRQLIIDLMVAMPDFQSSTTLSAASISIKEYSVQSTDQVSLVYISAAAMEIRYQSIPWTLYQIPNPKSPIPNFTSKHQRLTYHY